MVPYILAAVVGLVLGFLVDRMLVQRTGKGKLASASARAEKLLADAKRDADSLAKEKLQTLEAEWQKQKRQYEQEISEAKNALHRNKTRLEQRNEKLNRRTQKIVDRENLLHQAVDAVEALKRQSEKAANDADRMRSAAQSLHDGIRASKEILAGREAELEKVQAHTMALQTELDGLIDQNRHQLENLSGLTRQEARDLLMQEMITDAKLESATMIKEIRDEAKLKAARQSRKIVLTSIQRTAASHAIENTVSVVNIKSDDMKGRIIGREGRNIRAFEAATGIEVIVDDTPEAVILSGFDPVRREIARISLERLIQDGRIHPARIEEVVTKITAEIEEEIIELGERTTIDLGLQGLHPELIRLVGRMRYRSSYGQNLLGHSIEVAKLSSIMASELGLDARKARRAGLLHDIGKVVEGDLESPHAIVGMELCKKYKEHPEVCNAVGAHHDEIEMTGPLSPIIQASDAISGARPGARREALESYIKRLEQLEATAAGFDGVERVFAIQAGREIRVIVNHTLVSDAHAESLASDISKKIELEMQYPGQIKVTVIREVRSVSYAK